MKKIVYLFTLLICCLETFSQSACNNEDFEDAGLTYSVPSTVTITTSKGITGWTATMGTNSGVNQQIFSCIQTGCCSDTTGLLVTEISTNSPGGYIDPIIGTAYPLFSIFGTGVNNGIFPYGFNCYGNWFVKLNNTSAGTGITQLTHSFVITPSNANFKYAFISVTQTSTPGAHCCCNNSGFSVTFKDCLGNFLATSSQFSVAPDAGGSCSPVGPCTSGPIITFSTASSAAWTYNTWKLDSIDLSPWMGACITVDVRAFDCAFAGHAGYAYFDAQCSPLLTTSINYSSIYHGLKLYPNPNHGDFSLNVSNEIKNGEIELRNVLGQTVHRQNIKQGNNQIKTENLAKGIYNYTVLQDKVVVSVGKVVVE